MIIKSLQMTMGIEAHRRAKPYNMGTLYWQLNDCWPAISWSSIDYFGNWKALQYKAKKSFENVLISSRIKNDTIKTYVINDTFEGVQDDLQLKLQDFNGNVVWSKTQKININANSSQKFHQLPINRFDKQNLVLVAKFNENTSFFYLDKPKNLNLLKGEISRTITRNKEGFKIILKSIVLQKDIFLYSEERGHFSDNYFDLLPNEEVVIQFKTETETLNSLKIKTLNNTSPKE